MQRDAAEYPAFLVRRIIEAEAEERFGHLGRFDGRVFPHRWRMASTSSRCCW